MLFIRIITAVSMFGLCCGCRTIAGSRTRAADLLIPPGEAVPMCQISEISDPEPGLRAFDLVKPDNENMLKADAVLKKDNHTAYAYVDALDDNLNHGVKYKVIKNQIKSLTPQEYGSIYAYTGLGYKPINKALRSGGDKYATWKDVVIVLNSAISKLEKYTGKVYRREKVGGEIFEHLNENLAVGTRLAEFGFLSTSKNVNVTSGFGDKRAYEFLYEIESVNGFDLDLFNPGEKEVLFRPSSVFEVTRVERICKIPKCNIAESKLAKIYLKEVS